MTSKRSDVYNANVKIDTTPKGSNIVFSYFYKHVIPTGLKNKPFLGVVYSYTAL